MAKEMGDQIAIPMLNWLLAPEDPGVRYLAARDLLGIPACGAEYHLWREDALTQGPIGVVLNHMESDGFWAKPGTGYTPKYLSTVWSIILLSQLGASIEMDERIERACRYVLDHALCEGGQFSALASGAPSGTADCLQGNLCAALLDLGCDDPRLEVAFEWMARTVTGEGVAPPEDRDAPIRYYAGKCGPMFACGSNAGLPCAWGAVKVLLAFGKLPAERRTPLIWNAIEQGKEFLLGVDPATAGYPTGYHDAPSTNWWKFGFPVFYVTDILQIVEVLATLGYGGDPRLANAVALIRSKRDEQGRWAMEYNYTGKTWVDFGAKRKPNKWVTLRALKVLKHLS